MCSDRTQGAKARWTRRTLLASMLAAPALIARPARAENLRVATLDWAILETLLVLKADVIAATEMLQFKMVAVEPEIPDGVADLGLRGTPNFEAMRLAGPDLILNSNFYGWADPILTRIAPVESHSVYVTGQQPYGLAREMMLAIGARIGRRDSARQWVADTERHLTVFADALKPFSDRPVIPINLGDARHFRVFGDDSMFGETLRRLGLRNAWTQPTSYSAMAPIGLEALAGMPDASIVIIPPIPPDAASILPQSSFWNALPAVRGGHVVTLEPVNPFGALPAALRFARLLTKALTRGEGK